MMHFHRRGIEGFEHMKKCHIKKKIDEDSGEHYWEKVIGERSKNHQCYDQNLGEGGIILYDKNAFGVIPGLRNDTYEDMEFETFVRNSQQFNYEQSMRLQPKSTKDSILEAIERQQTLAAQQNAILNHQ